MLLFHQPSVAPLTTFLAAQSGLDLSYKAVGATAATPPPGDLVDHTRIRLGAGEDDFRAAKDALEHWQQFALGWVKAWPSDTPLRRGEVVAVVATAFGLWWMNACRIVYMLDEQEPVRRFGSILQIEKPWCRVLLLVWPHPEGWR